MCDGDLKCCLQGPEGVEPRENYGMARKRQSLRARAGWGLGFPGSRRRLVLCLWFERLRAGGCERGAHRKAPAAFYPCWTTVHDSPAGAPEEDLGVTAGESCRTWFSRGLLGQGTPLSCQHHLSPVPMGAPLLLQPPGCSLPRQGHTPSSPRPGTHVWQ